MEEISKLLRRKNSLRKLLSDASFTLSDFEKIVADISDIMEDAKLAEAEREEMRKKKADAVNNVAEMMKAQGLTVEDLAALNIDVTKTKTGKRGVVKPKYRLTQQDGTVKEWAGRGLQPKWVKEFIEQGGSLEDLVI